MRRFALPLALALSACGDYQGIVTSKGHPLYSHIVSEHNAGHNNITLDIDSGGGNLGAWRALALATTSPGYVGRVNIHGGCGCACLLYATTVANRGVPVYVDHDAQLFFQGEGTATHSEPDPSLVRGDLGYWQAYGLPRWVADIVPTLRAKQRRPMTAAEFDRAGFKMAP